MIFRFRNIALAALCCVLTTGLSAWADTPMTNPVTGETETYANVFTGGTSGTGTEWNSTDNWTLKESGKVPFVSSGNYDPALVDGKTASTSTAIDGYTMRLGAYNGAAVTWSGGITKIQGGTTGCWLTADETSSITIDSFAGNQLEGSDSAPFKLTSAKAGGITWSTGLTTASNTTLPFWYYFKGSGTVVYGGDITVANAQVIKQADITLSGTSQVASKTLVSFGAGTTKAFTANAIIKRFNSVGTDLNSNTAVVSINSTGVTTLTTSDAVGSCELVQTPTGIVLYWVDGDSSAIVAKAYKPSININFTNGAGNGLTTAADVGLSGYEVPGTSWNNYVVDNATFSTVNAIDSTGAASVMSGVSVTISGTRGSYSCSNLTPASNPLHGYVDEAAANMTPTVTVTGIPYDKYRVIVYHSTDSANVPFGYDTINGTNYTYVSSALAEGTTAWGASGAQNGANAIAEGVNTLVISEATGSTLTVVGHREGGASNARGCIAAMQIIDDTNNLVIPVYGETVYPVDVARDVSGTVYIIGNGTLTLTGTAKISAPTIDVSPGVTLNANADRLDSDTFIGSGTVAYNGVLPTTGKGWTEPTWTGTVWLKNYGAGGESTKVGVIGTDFGIADNNVMNGWGNANSSVKFTNVRGWCDTGSLPWTLILEDDGSTYAWYNNNGYSARETVFASLKGTGTLYDTGNTGCRQKITFTEASGFTGAFNVSGKRIGLGGSSTAANNATGSGSIEVVSGNSVTVSSDKVWTASGGIKVGGELRASGLARFGNSTTITTTDNGTFTLTDSNSTQDHGVDYARITGTGTLRYEDSTGWRTLSRVNFPTNMVCENNLSVGLILQASGQTHTIGSLAGNGRMRSDWGGSDNVGDRDLRILQARDTEFSGLFDDGTSSSSWDRLRDVIVAPGASSAGTLTFSGAQTATNGLVVESGASVNLTGTWVGATTVSGTFGGTGTLTGDLTFSEGSTLKVFASDSDGLAVSGALTCPATGTVKVDVSGIDLEGVYYLPLLSGPTSADTDKFELVGTSLPFSVVFAGSELGLERKSDYLELYEDYVTLTLNNIGTTPITNYTLLVRISEDLLPGFSYKRAGDGSKIAFSDGHGAPLSHEIDTWNPLGESLVWVKVPEAVDGTKIIFYWSLKAGKDKAYNDPKDVWSDYAGVWHMNDGDTLDATGANKTAQDESAEVRDDGVVGGALGKNSIESTPFLTITQTDAMKELATNTYTVSFWSYFNTRDVAGGPVLFASKNGHDTEGWGGRVITWGNVDASSGNNLRIYYGSGSQSNMRVEGLTMGVWLRNDVVFSPGSIGWYVNGVGKTASYSGENKSGSDYIYLGALPENANTGFNGAIDEFRIRAGGVETARLSAEIKNADFTDYYGAVEGDGKSFLVPGAVVTNGVINDYWRVDPSLSPLNWDIGTSPSLTYTPGVLRSGAEVSVTIETSAGTYLADFDGNPDSLLSISETGSYRLHFSRKDKTGAEVDDEDVYFTVTTPSGLDTVGDSASGRILLMNNDWTYGGSKSSPQISGQGWANTNLVEGASTFWRHVLDDASLLYNVMPGTNSTLCAVEDGGAVTNELWRLVNCRHGNPYPVDSEKVGSTDGLSAAQVYLPASADTASIKNTDPYNTRRNGVGQLLMQNTTKSAVYSPCYKDGIGTIYFDAVNGWKGNIYNYVDEADSSNTNAYQLVVEISTEPDDVDSENIPDSEWTPLKCHVVRVSADSPRLTEVAETTDIELAVTDGGKLTEFYRIYAPVEERGAVRFRIRRTAIDSSEATDLDANAYILLDNIIVSYPRMTADLRPAGAYFAKSGKDVLGMEGAFVDASGKAVLPVAGDTVYGRAVPEYYVNASTNLTATNFIASARMHYRWRYLNQLSDVWRVTSLDSKNNFRSENALELPDMVGDVEFWFDATISAPYYKYVDYSGQDLADEFVSKIYTEKVTSLVSMASAAESFGYPSAGTNWFVRLREAPAKYEGINVMTRASGESVCETNSMYLVSTNQWRGFVKTISEIEGGLDFRFEGVKLIADDDGAVTFVTNTWTASSEATNSLPASCGVEPGDGWQTAKCDAKTGYLVFTFDENREAISICHGDWQDFNHWSSAATNLFVGSSIDTNTTTDVTMEYDVDIADATLWPISKATNDNWSENFDVDAGQVTEMVYPRDVPIAITNSQHGWTVENASWTFQKWACNFGSGVFGGKSAVQLEGRGKGRLSYVSDTDYPDGLEYMQFTTRVAQFNEFNNFAYYSKGTNTSSHSIYFPQDLQDYTFTTFAALTLDKANQNFDGDGSISLVAYYDPSYGAYEVRVSRGGDNGERLRFVLLKWHATGGGMACTVLGTNNFDNVSIDGLMRSEDNIDNLCHFYVSVREYTTKANGIVTGTLIHAGLSRSADLTSKSRTPGEMTGQIFDNCVYFDTEASRLDHGTFGVLTRNCAGAFIKPVFFDSPITQIGTAAYGDFPDTANGRNRLDRYTNSAVTFAGDSTGNYPSLSGVSDAEKESRCNEYYKCWTLPPGRTEKYADTSTVLKRETWGFTGVTNVSQTIAVQTTPHGGSSWTTITNITVNGFMSTTNTCYLYTHSPCDVRLQVGGGPNDPRVDVTVDDVTLAKWNGEWTPNYNNNTTQGYPTNYVYTSAWIVKDSDEIGQKAVRLQPARAKTDDTPVSLRSPVLNGAGVFHFDWRNADTANTVLKLQKYEYPTVSIRNQLRYATEASVNDSTYKWIDIATINITEASGGKTFFLNKRYDGENSVVLRLVADTNVVATARAGTDPNYGSIEITDSYAWDLPPYDKRSWSGWNFRTQGWSDSKDSMWANLTDYRSGLSGLLNNTIDKNTLAEPHDSFYAGHMPYIQSPTFEVNCIGSVEFKARLYDPDVDGLKGYPALVTIYGAKKDDIDKETGEPKKWTKLDDIEVDGTVYEQKSAKFKAGDQYCVLRFSVKGVPEVESPTGDGDTAVDPNHNPPLRVAIDDICILERPIPAIRFKKGYARPFRNSDSIKDLKPVLDIATSAEQPILGETFGFQAEIEINDIEDEIVTDDPAKPITVYVAYYPYADTWGWQNWIGTTNETGKAVVAPLVKAEETNLVYRSTLDDSSSMCPAQFIGEDASLYDAQRYRLVQYHLFATFWDKAGEFHCADDAHHLDADEWDMPEWDRGFENPNAASDFSAFTLLETLAPKQAWINEVNFADGSSTLTSKTNQWIEIAVPSEEDMKYWSVRLYDNQANVAVESLFTFGLGNASSKVNNATEESGDYSFYVAKSPATTSLEASKVQATWSNASAYSITQGALYWDLPYGFELVRPSGVVEHSVVIQGCNQWEEYAKLDPGYAEIAAENSGTNLVALLKATVGGDWVWGEEDKFEHYGYTAGVTNNMGGVHEDWSSPLAPTPGKINVGQVIGDWLVGPNGGYYRIYSNISGDHVSQSFGGSSGPNSVVVTVTEGATTNIVFTVDKWYKLNCEVEPSDRTKLDDPESLVDGRRNYTLHLNSISNKITVTASAAASDEVDALIDSREAAYKPAIMKWLAEGKAGKGGDAFANPNGPLVAAVYRGHDGSRSDPIDLVGMYWLDLDPTQGGWELWGGMGSYHGTLPVITTTNRTHSIWGVTHTNIVFTAWLMITNTVTGGPAYPPYRLQGLNNEKSDEYTGNWTSVTFKVSMQLRAESLWRNLRYFVFDADSFSPATAAEPFTTSIEVMDPHSMQSPAAQWGWYNYDMTPWARWKIDTDSVPVGASILKQDDSLKDNYPPSGG